MLMPPPMNSQSALCLGVASSSRGNQATGTETTRPSPRTTVSVSAVQETSIARASLLFGKVLMPLLQKLKIGVSPLVYIPSAPAPFLHLLALAQSWFGSVRFLQPIPQTARQLPVTKDFLLGALNRPPTNMTPRGSYRAPGMLERHKLARLSQQSGPQ